jgi:hypothetical protein
MTLVAQLALSKIDYERDSSPTPIPSLKGGEHHLCRWTRHKRAGSPFYNWPSCRSAKFTTLRCGEGRGTDSKSRASTQSRFFDLRSARSSQH